MSYELHDLFRDRLSALPITAGRRGIAAMVMVEVVRWMSEKDFLCTKTADDLAAVLKIRPGDILIALKTLESLGAVDLESNGRDMIIRLRPMAAARSMEVLQKEISDAVSHHAAWKRRIRGAIDSGRCEMSVEEAGDAHNCPLGHWLRGSDFSGADRDNKYEMVCQLHDQFHRVAAATLQLALAGKRAEAERCMTAGGLFSETSSRLIKALGSWKRHLTR